MRVYEFTGLERVDWTDGSGLLEWTAGLDYWITTRAFLYTIMISINISTAMRQSVSKTFHHYT